MSPNRCNPCLRSIHRRRTPTYVDASLSLGASPIDSAVISGRLTASGQLLGSADDFYREGENSVLAFVRRLRIAPIALAIALACLPLGAAPAADTAVHPEQWPAAKWPLPRNAALD